MTTHPDIPPPPPPPPPPLPLSSPPPATTTGWRPRLRAEVLVREEAGGLVLADPATRFGLRLEAPWERQLIALLDGARTAPAIAALLAPHEASAAALMKSLRYLRMTDDADRAALARIRLALERPQELAARAPLRALPDARFECGSCGACCRSYTLGPLDPVDLATLERLPLAESFPTLAGRPPLRAVREGEGGGEGSGPGAGAGAGDDDGVLYFLNVRDDGRCVFLEDDGLCGLHKRFGAAAKPSFCQLFPHEAYRTPSAVYVVDNAGCATYGHAAFAGPPLRDQVARNPGLYRRAAAFGPTFHKSVVVDGGLVLDAEWTLPLELALVGMVEHPRGTVREALGALRVALERFRKGILAADDAAAPPDAIAARAAALPAAEAYAAALAEPVERARGLGALAALLDRMASLGAAARDEVARFEAEIGVDRPWAGTLVLEAARAAADLCRAEAAGEALPAGSAGARAAGVPLDLAQVDLDRRLRRLARDLLFARCLATAPTLRAGLAGLAITLALVTVGGRLAAAERGAATVGQADLDRAQQATIQLLAAGDLRRALLSSREASEAYAALTVL